MVDDQWTGREQLFGVASPSAPLSERELLLRRWLNLDVTFLPRPGDYRYEAEDAVPAGTFDEGWFRQALRSVLEDPCPFAVVFLDLLYGSERDIDEASGPKFLATLREHLPDVPVLILSNVEGTHTVRGIVKEGNAGRSGEVSFQDYLPKRVSNGPSLLDRLTEKLIGWADLSDPALCAFSPRMRRLARQMRRIVLDPERVRYQEGNADYPRPVVITGPVGGGKNYVANQMQAMSSRRMAPYRVAEFSGYEEKDFTTTLFGVGPHSEATTFYRVRRRDGAVLAARSDRTRIAAGHGDVVLTQLGILHEAHIAAQDPGEHQAPLQGTLLIDEIGTAPPAMQTRLLGVFNRGRFTPHLTAVNIPEEGAVDIWFLVTLSPEGQGKLRDDLRTRLEQGYRLDVPPLAERGEDVLPLVMLQLGPSSATEEPERSLTRQALRVLMDAATTMQVRELLHTVTRLRDVTSSRPYSAEEMRRALASGLATDAEGPDRPYEPGAHRDAPATDGALMSGPLDILRGWSEGGTVRFPTDLRSAKNLQGDGRSVVRGAAAAVLAFLELCAEATRAGGGYSSTRTWKFFAGEKGTKTAAARTRIASLFLIDDEATLEAIRRSDALLWLAWDVSGTRRQELRDIVERLLAEPGQVERARRIGISWTDQAARGSS